ncbi:hypothetical protein pEaSNUABM28_00170 [Erwinia phage pEa_SNUABM_28]|uniref:Uncharacterized protein n=1 Tax=Erwinia phage pEa_SNUABM_16 TaxID=2869544 RepID=A0AAE8XQH8_9CAUD|nr:hypothetical protein MPK64_gp168 [Erwinia phage pEa_SNUABM_16]QZE58727.1 hypothetical protein pEaSNUABM28_00170 [Erwinia phage pEa_SNUABM_28]QZE59071.1 hypothetical protein pEaSNUABM18_00168 [Erwinia phage pEa_SNUABM_18]UAW96312.1 hypothetical protein pEaSNUABM16_00168 [Erwinia phage pEa_SNUABM_16]
MRLDQLQRYMKERGYAHAIAYHMGVTHLDWISKDTDMQAEHWTKHSLSWEVPEGPYDFDGWSKDIAEKMKLEAAWLEYEPTLEPDTKGKLMIYGFRYHPNKDAASGWNVVFSYTYIDPELALM